MLTADIVTLSLFHPAHTVDVLQKQDAAMLELAKQLKDANSLMFFARGNNYATALEAALKVRVCGCVRACVWGVQGAAWCCFHNTQSDRHCPPLSFT